MRFHIYILPLLFCLAQALPHPQEGEEDEEETVEGGGEDDQEYELVGADEELVYSTGLLEPDEEDIHDAVSASYFDELDDLVGASTIPEKFSALEKGMVNPIQDQGLCGSCAAFATVAALEACYKNSSGKLDKYSEQYFLDCAYQQNGAKGCVGAPAQSYVVWVDKEKKNIPLAEEVPYQSTKSKFVCPATSEPKNRGAKVTASYYTYNGTEELMKTLVSIHGAVVATVTSKGPFSKYKSGIFSGCKPGGKVDHAIAVVGYGTEKAKKGGKNIDYWIIRNSWGPKWGEKGYMRLKRGVGMCNIGKFIGTLKCEKTQADSGEEPSTEEESEEDEDLNGDIS